MLDALFNVVWPHSQLFSVFGNTEVEMILSRSFMARNRHVTLQTEEVEGAEPCPPLSNPAPFGCALPGGARRLSLTKRMEEDERPPPAAVEEDDRPPAVEEGERLPAAPEEDEQPPAALEEQEQPPAPPGIAAVALLAARPLDVAHPNAAAQRLQTAFRKHKAMQQRLRRAAAAITIKRWGKAALAKRQARQWRHAEMRAQAQAAARVQAKFRAARGRSLPGYAGEYDSLGRPHGHGKRIDDDGGWYEGEWVHGERRGAARRLWADGSMYEGQWDEDGPNGMGTHVTSEGGVRRHGVWERGVLHGEGAMVVPAGEDGVGYEYSGQFVRGMREGLGTETRGDESYEGQWLEDARHGLGTLKCSDGASYRGEWRHGVRHGEGEHTTKGGGYTSWGTWDNDELRHGKVRGKWTGEYEGQLRVGTGAAAGRYERHGRGKWTSVYARPSCRPFLTLPLSPPPSPLSVSASPPPGPRSP